MTWAILDKSVASISSDKLTTVVTGINAGKTQITATSATQVAYATVVVQGIVLKDSAITLFEGENYTLGYEIFGDQLGSNVEWTSSNTDVVAVSNGYLMPKKEGESTITAKVVGATYTDTCKVIVKRNTAQVISRSVEAGQPLDFSQVESAISTQCQNVLGRSLSYVSGLTVSTRQGTLYYRYQNEGDTGFGVGTGERYYLSPSLGQMGLSDVTFVPKDDFSGTAVINYTGYADGSTFFQGTIEVQVGEWEEIYYSTKGNQPVQFVADDFNRLCKVYTRAGSGQRGFLSAGQSGRRAVLPVYLRTAAGNQGGFCKAVPAQRYAQPVQCVLCAWRQLSGRSDRALYGL